MYIIFGACAGTVGSFFSFLIRFELAQFREVEAFAFLVSQLGETTKATLERGSRLVELLKQYKYSPLVVETELLMLFSGIRGYTDLLSLN